MRPTPTVEARLRAPRGATGASELWWPRRDLQWRESAQPCRVARHPRRRKSTPATTSPASARPVLPAAESRGATPGCRAEQIGHRRGPARGHTVVSARREEGGLRAGAPGLSRFGASLLTPPRTCEMPRKPRRTEPPSLAREATWPRSSTGIQGDVRRGAGARPVPWTTAGITRVKFTCRHRRGS